MHEKTAKHKGTIHQRDPNSQPQRRECKMQDIENPSLSHSFLGNLLLPLATRHTTYPMVTLYSTKPIKLDDRHKSLIIPEILEISNPYAY